MQIFNHNNSNIVMERGKFLNTMPIFFDNYFAMSTSSFTMLTSANHDNSYIVMERGKFLSTMPIIFGNISVMSTSSFTIFFSYIVMEHTMPFFWQLFCHVYKFLCYAEF